jgi:hypothetical protein
MTLKMCSDLVARGSGGKILRAVLHYWFAAGVLYALLADLCCCNGLGFSDIGKFVMTLVSRRSLRFC